MIVILSPDLLLGLIAIYVIVYMINEDLGWTERLAG